MMHKEIIRLLKKWNPLLAKSECAAKLSMAYHQKSKLLASLKCGENIVAF